MDDQSPDGTVEVARHTGAAVADRLTILPGALLPAGSTDMLWAIKQGVEHPQTSNLDYFLLTESDIVLRPHCAHAPRFADAERALIPAFTCSRCCKQTVMHQFW